MTFLRLAFTLALLPLACSLTSCSTPDAPREASRSGRARQVEEAERLGQMLEEVRQRKGELSADEEYLAALFYYWQGAYQQALASCDTLVRVSPERARTARLLEALCCAAVPGNRIEGMSALETLVREDEGDVMALMLRGEVNMRGGDSVVARVCLERARELQPAFPRVYLRLAQLAYIEKHGSSEVLRYLREYFSLALSQTSNSVSPEASYLLEKVLRQDLAPRDAADADRANPSANGADQPDDKPTPPAPDKRRDDAKHVDGKGGG